MSSNKSGESSGASQAQYEFIGVTGREHRFRPSMSELVTTFDRQDVNVLVNQHFSDNAGYEVLGYGDEIKDAEGNEVDGVARLAVFKKKTIGQVVKSLTSSMNITGWIPAMEEIVRRPVTRWFLPSFIVQLKTNVSSDIIEDTQPTGWGLKILRKHRKPGLYAVSLSKVSDVPPEKILFDTMKQTKTKTDFVKFVEVDEIGTGKDLLLDSTDPGYTTTASRWHHRDSSYEAEVYTGGTAPVPPSYAWDVTIGVTNVVIAFVDTGVRLSHVDFSGKIELDSNWFDGSGTYNDTNGHGTKVAGVAAASAAWSGSGQGIAGIAPNCRILVAKASLTESAPYSQRADAINWVTTKATDPVNTGTTGKRYILNMSWRTTTWSDLIEQAIIDAYAGNVLLVAAAGDDSGEIARTNNPAPPAGSTIVYPASYPECIAAGSYTRSSSKPRLLTSNVGTFVIMAPGQSIAYPTLSNTGWAGTGSGTSISAAIVSGICALAWSRNFQLNTPPRFSRGNVDVRNWLEGAAALPANGIVGYPNAGRANARHTVNNAVV